MIGIKAKARGIAGFVLDGAARDIEALRDLGVPVFARACTPAGPHKRGPFRLLEPIAAGGRDGVTVVGRAHVGRTVVRASQIAANEVAKRITNAKPIR
jgi:regulator of RNase E activity RraA